MVNLSIFLFPLTYSFISKLFFEMSWTIYLVFSLLLSCFIQIRFLIFLTMFSQILYFLLSSTRAKLKSLLLNVYVNYFSYYIIKSKVNHILNVFTLLPSPLLYTIYFDFERLLHFFQDKRACKLITYIIIYITKSSILISFSIHTL